MLTKKDKKKRYNKKTRSSDIHLFSGTAVQNFKDSFKGDKLGGTIGALGSNVAGIIGESIKEPELQGTEAVTDAIETQQNFQSSANTNDDVLAEMAGFTNVRTDYNAKEFKRGAGKVAGEFIGDSISSFASGASSGSWITGLVNTGLSWIKNGIKRGRENAAAKQFAQDAPADAKKANLAKAQTLTAKAGALDQAADQRALAAYAAYGGDINTPKFPDFPSEITEFNTGGSHEENPYDGIPQGIAPDGLPNLVEEGEVKYDNYIFSDRLMLNKNDKKKYKFLKGKTYADAAKAIKRELGIDERPNDLIAKTDLEEHLNILSTLQEEERAKRGLRGENRMMYKDGGHLFAGPWDQTILDSVKENTKGLSFRDSYDKNALSLKGYTGQISRKQARDLYNEANGIEGFDWSSTLQAAPALGSAVGVIESSFDKPIYEHTKELTKAENPVAPITYTPTHQDIKLPRFDKSFYMNKADAQAAATRRAIREQTGSNPYTSTSHLLVADAQGNATRGDIRKQGEEMEINRILQEAQFNSAGRRADAEGLLKASSSNAALQDKALSRQAEKDAMAARLKMAEDQAYDAAISANMTSLFDNLGAMGKEKKEFALAALKALGEGKMTPEQLAIYAKQFPEIGKYLGYKGKYGGRLRRKKGYTI